MSVRWFFCRMMAVALCLMMQLPLLVMPAAMASAGTMDQMAGRAGDMPGMAVLQHAMMSYRMLSHRNPLHRIPAYGAALHGVRKVVEDHTIAHWDLPATASGVSGNPAMQPAAQSATQSAMGWQAASSHGMARMLVRAHSPSWGMRMGGNAAPCCQSHHGSCDAGLLPAGPRHALPQGARLAFQHYALRFSLRSSIVPPWRPPAVLPV